MAEAENTARPASEERGEVSLVLDGATMALRPSYEAIFAFEASTDKGLLELARAALEGKMRLADLSQVVTECIRAWGRATQQPSIAASNAVRIGQLIVEAEGGMARELHCLGGSEGGDDDDDDERSPRRKLSSFAIAALGWQPDQFWRATPHEFWTAVEGYERLNRAAQP